MVDHITLGLLALIALILLINVYRKSHCVEITDAKEREIARRVADGFRIGHAAGMQAAKGCGQPSDTEDG